VCRIGERTTTRTRAIVHKHVYARARAWVQVQLVVPQYQAVVGCRVTRIVGLLESRGGGGGGGKRIGVCSGHKRYDRCFARRGCDYSALAVEHGVGGGGCVTWIRRTTCCNVLARRGFKRVEPPRTWNWGDRWGCRLHTPRYVRLIFAGCANLLGISMSSAISWSDPLVCCSQEPTWTCPGHLGTPPTI
jgi:hypothetical protein